ncbi:MAG: hypothetical protein KDA85_11105, partial [Planctomycetaceae bacterium]|nr:hypothetical protein [Planctomycetaceae bacterium]
MMQLTGLRRLFRRFFRHRSAVASSVIVLFYLLIALVLLSGSLLTEEDVSRRFGPMHLPGFGRHATLEKRVMDCEWYVRYFEVALQKSDPGKALQNLERVGMLQPRTDNVTELNMIVTSCEQLLVEIDTSIEQEESGQAAVVLVEQLEQTIPRLFEPLTETQQAQQSRALLLGTDRQGRSILYRSVFSIRTAVMVGAVTGLISVMLGSVLGMAAGLYGGVVDGIVTWLYSTLASIPNLVLLVLLAHVFGGSAIDDYLNQVADAVFAETPAVSDNAADNATDNATDNQTAPAEAQPANTFTSWLGGKRIG